MIKPAADLQDFLLRTHSAIVLRVTRTKCPIRLSSTSIIVTRARLAAAVSVPRIAWVCSVKTWPKSTASRPRMCALGGGLIIWTNIVKRTIDIRPTKGYLVIDTHERIPYNHMQ